MLYRFNQSMGFEFFQSAIALIPAFAKILADKDYGQDAAIWLLAIHDPRSPYQEKYLKEQERIAAINYDMFKRTTIGWQDDELMEAACDALREHYWDEDVYQLNAVNIAIREETKTLSIAPTATERNKCADSLASLNKLRTTLLENIGGKIRTNEFDKIKLKSGKQISFLMKDQQAEKMADANA